MKTQSIISLCLPCLLLVPAGAAAADPDPAVVDRVLVFADRA